jgi:hypothetical protein
VRHERERLELGLRPAAWLEVENRGIPLLRLGSVSMRGEQAQRRVQGRLITESQAVMAYGLALALRGPKRRNTRVR